MDEIRIVGPGKTRGYPYPICKKRIVGPGKTRGYPYPVCKNTCTCISRISRQTVVCLFDTILMIVDLVQYEIYCATVCDFYQGGYN